MPATSTQDGDDDPPSATDDTALPAASLSEVVARTVDAADADTITIGAVTGAVGRASFAPILLLPALAVSSPLSGIPFFSGLMGIIICLVSMQMLVRREKVWLPQWILRREVKGNRVREAFTTVKPAARWLDAKAGKRFQLLARRPLVFLPQLLCFLSGLCMPLLEFIPFSSSILGVGVVLLAFGMLAKDGLIILIGLFPYGIVTWMIFG